VHVGVMTRPGEADRVHGANNKSNQSVLSVQLAATEGNGDIYDHIKDCKQRGTRCVVVDSG
jgi:hypothetical protein